MRLMILLYFVLSFVACSESEKQKSLNTKNELRAVESNYQLHFDVNESYSDEDLHCIINSLYDEPCIIMTKPNRPTVRITFSSLDQQSEILTFIDLEDNLIIRSKVIDPEFYNLMNLFYHNSIEQISYHTKVSIHPGEVNSSLFNKLSEVSMELEEECYDYIALEAWLDNQYTFRKVLTCDLNKQKMKLLSIIDKFTRRM